MCINILTRLVCCLPSDHDSGHNARHAQERQGKKKSFVDTTQKVVEITAAESPQFTAVLHSVWVWPRVCLSASLCSGRMENLRCLVRKLSYYYH